MKYRVFTRLEDFAKPNYTRKQFEDELRRVLEQDLQMKILEIEVIEVAS